MKANLLKISVLATVLIFLSAGASWADRRDNRHHKKAEKKQFRSEYKGSRDYREPSHSDRNRYEHPRRHYKKHFDRHLAAHRKWKHHARHHHKYHRPVHKHDQYRYNKKVHKHYHKHKRSNKVISFRVPDFDPGWSVIIKTKSRW